MATNKKAMQSSRISLKAAARVRNDVAAVLYVSEILNRFSTKILKILEYSAPYIKILACSEIQKLATSTSERVE